MSDLLKRSALVFKRGVLLIIICLVPALLMPVSSYAKEIKLSDGTVVHDDLMHDSPLVLSGSGYILTCMAEDAAFVKMGRYTGIRFTLANDTEKKFNGFIRISLSGNRDSIYQIKADVSSGETGEFSITFPAVLRDSTITISLIDHYGETIITGLSVLNPIIGSSSYLIGVISKTTEGYDYLNSSERKVLYVDPDRIGSDYRDLDRFSVIIIDGISKDEIGEETCETIRKWTLYGGTLLLTAADSGDIINEFAQDMYTVKSIRPASRNFTFFGVGADELKLIKENVRNDILSHKVQFLAEYCRKNMDPDQYLEYYYYFSDLGDTDSILSRKNALYDYFKDTEGKAKADTLFSNSLSDKEESIVDNIVIFPYKTDITSLSILNAQPVIVENGENIISKVNTRLGICLFSEVSLKIPEEDAFSYSDRLGDVLDNSLSITESSRIRNEAMDLLDTANENYVEGLKINDRSSIPNITLYAIILLIYSGLIPVIFLACRRSGRTFSMIWMVPLSAVFFSMIIYMLGSVTRIEKPFVNFLSQIKVVDSESSVLQNYFSITNSDNSHYSIKLPADSDVSVLADETFTTEKGTLGKAIKSIRNNEKYNYGISYSGRSTDILVDRSYAFQQNFFESSSMVNEKRNIFCDLVFDSGRLTGEVTNNFPYDLDNVFIYSEGNIYMIGNVKSKERRNISIVTGSSDTMAVDDMVNDSSQAADTIIGHGSLDQESMYSAEDLRKKALIISYLTQMSNVSGSFIYGFSSKDNNSFIKSLNMDAYGVTGIAQDITVTLKYRGSALESNLSDFAAKFNTSQTDGIHISDSVGDDDEISVEYVFNGNIPRAAAYTWSGNPEFLRYTYDNDPVFKGTVYFVNNDGKKVKVFDSENAGIASDLSDFINTKDRTLTVIYKVDKSRADLYYHLPVVKLAF